MTSLYCDFPGINAFLLVEYKISHFDKYRPFGPPTIWLVTKKHVVDARTLHNN